MKRPSAIRCERGATMTEHAIVLPLFIGLLLVAFDFLRLSYIRLSLQFALTDMARTAAITPTTAGYNPLTDLSDQLRQIGVTWNPAVDRLTVCPQVATCATGTINRGAPHNLIVYRASLRVNLFLPRNSRWQLGRGNIDINTMVMARNEPPA